MDRLKGKVAIIKGAASARMRIDFSKVAGSGPGDSTRTPVLFLALCEEEFAPWKLMY